MKRYSKKDSYFDTSNYEIRGKALLAIYLLMILFGVLALALVDDGSDGTYRSPESNTSVYAEGADRG